MKFYARILGYFRRDWKLVALLVVFIHLSLAAGLLIAWPVGILVDTVLLLARNDDWVHRLFRAALSPLPQGTTARIVGIAAIGLLLKVAQDALQFLRNMISHRLQYNGTARVRRDLFDRLQSLSPAYHRSRPQGDALYRLSTDALGFFEVVNTFIGAAVSCSTLLYVAVVMWRLDVR